LSCAETEKREQTLTG
jgi:hypothetical protein